MIRFSKTIAILSILLGSSAFAGMSEQRAHFSKIHFIASGDANVLGIRGVAPDGTKLNIILSSPSRSKNDFLKECHKRAALAMADDRFALELGANTKMYINSNQTDGRGYRIVNVNIDSNRTNCLVAPADKSIYDPDNQSFKFLGESGE